MTAMPNPIYDDERPLDEGLPDGMSLLDGAFTITGRLSQSAIGFTYLAKDNGLNRSVVIKECFPEGLCQRGPDYRATSEAAQFQAIVDTFTQEARSIAKLQHPHIIGINRVFEQNDTAYMVLDLIDGDDLLHVTEGHDRKLSASQIKDVLLKLLEAIDLIHAEDLLHKNISPSNILIDLWGSPVLFDFGAAQAQARKKPSAIANVMIVKDGYTPQEFYFSGSTQSPSSDLYALAATFYHVISGQAPVTSQSRVSNLASDKPDPYVPLAGSFPEYDDDFLAAIDKTMRISAKERIQSARDWIDLITSKPADVAPEPSAQPAASELVPATNDVLVMDKPVEIAASPEAEMSPLTDGDMAEWVKECNEETMRGDTPVEMVKTPKFSYRIGFVPADQASMGSGAYDVPQAAVISDDGRRKMLGGAFSMLRTAVLPR